MAEATAPVEIFCCYSHEDEMWLRKLETHLSLLQRQGLISFWHDRRISPGIDWAQAIDHHLETASVILLLVSADFLASDYCYSIEMQRALERQEAGEARVIPILVRPVDWTDAPFAHLQALPTDAKPIASWRDKDTALADVAAAIRRAIVEDLPQLSASAPRAVLSKIWNIPYPRNPFFLGRDAELALVRHSLQAGQATALSQPQAISGLGGIGKTQLALEYAYRYYQDYQVVLWARAESTEALVSSYIALATLLRLPECEVKEQEITVQAVKVWLQVHRGWLLILDNADELTLLSDFLPPSLGGHLLLTTRAASTGRLAQRLEIETLLSEDGALFLLRRAGFIAPDAELSQASQEEQELALQLSQELGGLPLALDQAGAYIDETSCGLSGYQRLYQRFRADLLQQRRGLVADHPASVTTTWSLSFQRVEEKNSAAAELLRLCAFLSPDAIPEEILTAGASQLGSVLGPVAAEPLLLNQAIEALRAYSLIRRDPRGKTLSIHRLVQAVLRNTMPEEVERAWAERAVRAMSQIFPWPQVANWEMCRQLLSHAQACAALIERWQMELAEGADLLYNVGYYLRERAVYHEARAHCEQALAIYRAMMGEQHPSTAASLQGLEIVYRDQRKYPQAEAAGQQALAIRRAVLGEQHPDTAASLNNLALVYKDQGKYQQAEALHHQALTIYQTVLGYEHPTTARCVYGLALLYEIQGIDEKALLLFERALVTWQKTLGYEHPDTKIAQRSYEETVRALQHL